MWEMSASFSKWDAHLKAETQSAQSFSDLQSAGFLSGIFHIHYLWEMTHMVECGAAAGLIINSITFNL